MMDFKYVWSDSDRQGIREKHIYFSRLIDEGSSDPVELIQMLLHEGCQLAPNPADIEVEPGGIAIQIRDIRSATHLLFNIIMIQINITPLPTKIGLVTLAWTSDRGKRIGAVVYDTLKTGEN